MITSGAKSLISVDALGIMLQTADHRRFPALHLEWRVDTQAGT
jgi:hypothetical protein